MTPPPAAAPRPHSPDPATGSVGDPAAWAAGAATALPTLLAHHVSPASTVYNQLLSLLLWGLALGLLTRTAQPQEALRRGLFAGLAGLGLAGVGIGCVQVFAPGWADGTWIARSAFEGRAVGNVRQPNHLATLLLWAAVGWVGWRALPRPGAPAGWGGWGLDAGVLALLVAGVVLTASRTGLVLGIPLLLLWGALDRSLPPSLRRLLLATPLMAAAAWGLLDLWASQTGGVFGAQTRLDTEGAGSPSRLKILANTWTLIQQNPGGVGWGEFNRAWTLTPFPDRPVAFFDHCHNLPLQLIVELGWLGGGAAVLALCGLLAWGARRAVRATAEQARARRAALLLLLVVGAHSLLEYPLWYAYFLLPTLAALALVLWPAEGVPPALATLLRGAARTAALVLVGASLHAFTAYQRVAAIYAPAPDGTPLQARIAAGQEGFWFSRHADYAAATALGESPAALAAARRTSHQLIDARLLIAWAKNLHAAGEVDRARFLVARLREFRAREGEAWLAGCANAPEAWFCQAPEQAHGWQSF